ncbi:MAG TPA: hypothetical protein PK514_11740 [Spirochaetota bacterium]|nr:hypothetical protein [Spirochaetota bacterium]
MGISTEGINSLHLQEKIKKDLKVFLNEIFDLYRDDLVSIIAFGSCVSSDFNSDSSDINLLVIYSDLNIVDLDHVAMIAQRWARKRNFAPRFLSRKNLTDSARYFQIDMLEMKDSHIILCGEDILQQVPVDEKNMLWQLSHDLKSIRMRIKQQYWRSSGNPVMMKNILVKRFTSLAHLARVMLFLMKKQPPSSLRDVMTAAQKEFGLSGEFIEKMFNIKSGRLKPGRKELASYFQELMDLIRSLDNAADGIRL